MPDFIGKRFDDRIVSREDDGAAFEQFVDEFLRLEEPEKRLVRGLARGADGAIDLTDAGQKLEHIVECKFIGAETKSTAEERWGEVKRHLDNNLLRLARGDENRRKKYRPWLKSEGDLKTYTFISSSICPSADARNKLRAEISGFFSNISNKHDELSHLKSVEVDLRYWDDIAGKSAMFAPLFYRWFGGFPHGYGEISASFGAETGFKQFLANRNLPYFSRDSHLMETKLRSASEFDTILKFLSQGNDAKAQVIFGPGGVGKTRLSIELCEKARDLGWWPIRLDRKASVVELDSICQSHATAAKLLLFIDYAEAFEGLDRLAEAATRLVSDGGHQVAIIASTRSSSLQKVTDLLSDLQAETTGLLPEKERDGYTDWLVDKIVGHFCIPHAEHVAKSCKGLPVMAAFAGFLYKKDRTQFDLQFGNLASVKDFTGWSSNRLKAIEDRFPGQPVQSLLAELAVQMPMSIAEAALFRASTDLKRDVFDILKADRWIESEGETYSAAHDILTDAILSRHLSAMPGTEQDRLNDIVVAALKEDRLDRCLAALDRLGDHPVFERLSGKSLIEALMAYDSGKTLAALPSFTKSRLLNHAELIALLASSNVLRIRIAEAPETHVALALAAEWAATKGQFEIDRSLAVSALSAPLGSAVALRHHSNMVLRCAYTFDPQRFHDDVIERIQAAPVALHTHYLIVSLLTLGTPTDDVLPHLVPWIAQNDNALKASHVYKAWLDAKGEVETIREKMFLWLERHGQSHDAQYVYKAWLDATGEVDAVREKLLLWVEEHGQSPVADFVYNAWLDAAGEEDAIREELLLWLQEHGQSPDAQFVYKAWLDATGDLEAVREKLFLWVAEHGQLLEASYVYKAWLDAKGEVETVREKLHLWVEEHGQSPTASHVYRAWLEANGGVETVREGLILWMEVHGQSQTASHVYKAWLIAKGGIEAVREKLLLWVEEHCQLLEASYVYKAWLDATGEVKAVREKLLLWLEEHGRSLDASRVYNAWLDADGEAEIVREKLLLWMEEHGRSLEASYVYKAWLGAKGEVETVREKLHLWVEEHGQSREADFVYKAWLDAELPYEEIQSHCEAWFLENWRLESAVFVSKALSSRSDLRLDIAAHIMAWAGVHAEHEDAIFRLSRVSRVLADPIPANLVSIFEKSTLAVFQNLLSNGTPSQSEKDACAILFGNISKGKDRLTSKWLVFLDLFYSCLCHGNILQNFPGLPSGTWVVLLRDATTKGLLDPIKDHIAINHAHSLVRGSISAEDYAYLLKHNYLSEIEK
ncbi:hypothetical protein J7426_23445 [Tropicibacter sp. R16_0]|uniref:hypothetical protein n=1 Tax=Tropicibacter sp. R16_0 TaxID=2821102 RepID=UPI001AD9DFB0|nr:hypothetical protein [Tropicibacter sp. R16_0]MBO9453236.1 hypothetical protein [Tropicibacter sp. R16_0]